MDLKPCDTTSSQSQPPGGWPSPRAAYLHVPFCRHRCGYCNFSVVTDRDDLTERFLQAIDGELAILDCPKVRTVFIGGGTPTHLDPSILERLLLMVRQRFELESEYEWSVEANPDDINEVKLDLLAEHGVNRLSLGIQSFDDRKLHSLERSHRGQHAVETVQAVHRRIANVSLDLIFAAPGESIETWRRDLETALSLPISHLSTYALTFEKGTSFWSRRHRGELIPLDESLEVEMYEHARMMTAQNGLNHYEISNFAREGLQCQHNLSYWKGAGWYGAGPGAARFVDGRREVNHRSTTSYLKRIESGQSPTAEIETISITEHAREQAAFGIRMLAGININEVSRNTGVDLRQVCREAIRQCIDEGLLQETDSQLSLTESGILFADMVASRMLG